MADLLSEDISAPAILQNQPKLIARLELWP